MLDPPHPTEIIMVKVLNIGKPEKQALIIQVWGKPLLMARYSQINFITIIITTLI
jgi:hypothetical protein